MQVKKKTCWHSVMQLYQKIINEFRHLAKDNGKRFEEIWPYDARPVASDYQRFAQEGDKVMVVFTNENFDYPYRTAAHFATRITPSPGLQTVDSRDHAQPTDQQPGASLSKAMIFRAPTSGLFWIDRETKYMGSADSSIDKVLVIALPRQEIHQH
jgi:hypothetical protein